MIDVATALVCAPDARSFESGLKDVGLGDIMDDGSALQTLQRRMTLREALKIEVESAPQIHKKDPAHAEALIRLYRRVEAQAAHPQTTMMAHDDGMAGLDATLQGALDGTLGADQTGLMGDVSGHQGISDVMGGGGDHGDIMDGLMGGGGDGDDLLDPFGVGSGDLGDGMGF
jgi:mediator of RNA polymerase II transcription subunit 5